MSKRYEEKERAGELHSEFKRIEDKSKAKAEQGQQQQLQDELKSSIGRRRNRDTGEKDEEPIVENGEVCSGLSACVRGICVSVYTAW